MLNQLKTDTGISVVVCGATAVSSVGEVGVEELFCSLQQVEKELNAKQTLMRNYLKHLF